MAVSQSGKEQNQTAHDPKQQEDVEQHLDLLLRPTTPHFGRSVRPRRQHLIIPACAIIGLGGSHKTLGDLKLLPALEGSILGVQHVGYLTLDAEARIYGVPRASRQIPPQLTSLGLAPRPAVRCAPVHSACTECCRPSLVGPVACCLCASSNVKNPQVLCTLVPLPV